mmetsp:Transcript_127140/g.354022  ORF Transcript_127140/g.354022 Transcript_127140/m.354022 type:complete len:122 (+) Transcript_127140:77-442(+)
MAQQLAVHVDCNFWTERVMKEQRDKHIRTGHAGPVLTGYLPFEVVFGKRATSGDAKGAPSLAASPAGSRRSRSCTSLSTAGSLALERRALPSAAACPSSGSPTSGRGRPCRRPQGQLHDGH